MNESQSFPRSLLFLMYGASILGIFAYIWLNAHIQPQVLSTITQNMTISADIPHNVTLSIDPEKRVFPDTNKSVQAEVEFREPGSTTPLYTETITSNDMGQAHLSPITTDIIPEGTYDISIKGISHLRMNFANQLVTGPSSLTFDFSATPLLAGDSHPSADNFVNSLDISYTVINLYANTLRADLNRDHLVNSLDLSILLNNLYKHGDP